MTTAMAPTGFAISAARARAERIRRGMEGFVATRREIAVAYAKRDWATLGYESFDAYVESEFSEARLKLTPDERREAVAELRLAGMSQRAIAATLGISQSAVRDEVSELSISTQLPDAVTSADGKQRPATRPASDPPADLRAAVLTNLPEPTANGITIIKLARAIHSTPVEVRDVLAELVDAGEAACIPGESADRYRRPSPETPEPHVVGNTTTPAGGSGPTSNAMEDSATVPTSTDAPDFTRLDAQLDAEMEGTDQRFRRNFSSALVKAVAIWQFDVDRIAQAYAADFEREIQPHLDEMERWCSRVRAARKNASGLRLVKGDAR